MTAVWLIGSRSAGDGTAGRLVGTIFAQRGHSIDALVSCSFAACQLLGFCVFLSRRRPEAADRCVSTAVFCVFCHAGALKQQIDALVQRFFKDLEQDETMNFSVAVVVQKVACVVWVCLVMKKGGLRLNARCGPACLCCGGSPVVFVVVAVL